MEKKRTRRVYFSPETYAKLKANADKLGQSVNDYANELLLRQMAAPQGPVA